MTDNRTSDTREKLEEDVERLIGKIQERIFSGRDAGALRFQLHELLDRQAMITERHWMETVGASANANVELKRQIDELESGTCRIMASATDGLCSDNPRHYFELSCGHSFTLDGLGAPVACPHCGARVKE